MSEFFTLDDNHEVVLCDLVTWANMIEDIDKRRVASDYVNDYHVSTVFLGLDHGFGLGGKKLLFETMIFDKEGGMGREKYIDRYSTWDEAVKGHRDACRIARYMDEPC